MSESLRPGETSAITFSSVQAALNDFYLPGRDQPGSHVGRTFAFLAAYSGSKQLLSLSDEDRALMDRYHEELPEDKPAMKLQSSRGSVDPNSRFPPRSMSSQITYQLTTVRNMPGQISASC